MMHIIIILPYGFSLDSKLSLRVFCYYDIRFIVYTKSYLSHTIVLAYKNQKNGFRIMFSDVSIRAAP